jgi:uncharacterized protein YndB with AHSA1/START domain
MKKNDFKLSPSGEREIVMTRTFDAPRHLIFEAWTKPEILKRWLLGPDGWSMPVCDVDLRVGGKYRFVWRRDSDGTEMGMGGVYCEIAAPERLVASEKFDEAWYPGEAISTVALTEKDGRTSLTNTVVYESKEARDGVLESGMERGVAVSYERLDDVLAAMAKR